MVKSFFKNLQALRRGRLPGQVVIQLTDKCSARCPQCGMRVTENFPRSKLPGEQVERIIRAAAERGVAALSITGGEPLLYVDEVVSALRCASEAGIQYTRTGTNGFLFSNPQGPRFETRVHRVAEKPAGAGLRNFWISIDSSIPEVHEEMRGFSGVVRGIEKALKIFHEHGIYPSANLGINRRINGPATESLHAPSYRDEGEYLEAFYYAFEEAFRRFFRFVIDLGFSMASLCYPMSVDAPATGLQAVYGATSTDRVVQFSRREKEMLFKALLQATPEYRSRIRIFSPLVSIYTLYKEYAQGPGAAYPCRGGLDYFFIYAGDGNAYPCGYRGAEDFGKYWQTIPSIQTEGDGCRRCDWECFRDPSEFLGFAGQAFTHPFQMLSKLREDPRYFRLWLDDLRYCRVCNLYDGRTPPDYKRMARFRSLDGLRRKPALLT